LNKKENHTNLIIIKEDYRKQASLTILNFEFLSLDFPFKINFGETESDALSDNLSFFDFSIILKKHSQF
tara:strand:- start:85 stop:291 length:207 start_codon:yes stop_codon:yes gene_type:complete